MRGTSGPNGASVARKRPSSMPSSAGLSPVVTPISSRVTSRSPMRNVRSSPTRPASMNGLGTHGGSGCATRTGLPRRSSSGVMLRPAASSGGSVNGPLSRATSVAANSVTPPPLTNGLPLMATRLARSKTCDSTARFALSSEATASAARPRSSGSSSGTMKTTLPPSSSSRSSSTSCSTLLPRMTMDPMAKRPTTSAKSVEAARPLCRARPRSASLRSMLPRLGSLPTAQTMASSARMSAPSTIMAP